MMKPSTLTIKTDDADFFYEFIDGHKNGEEYKLLGKTWVLTLTNIIKNKNEFTGTAELMEVWQLGATS